VACWGNPRRDIAILRQGACGRRCKTFSPCLHSQQNYVRIRPMRGSVSPTGKSAILKGCVIFLSDRP
ncbi:MAG: hypothetical protein RSE18_14140, partial [Acinetobacter sp.]